MIKNYDKTRIAIEKNSSKKEFSMKRYELSRFEFFYNFPTFSIFSEFF